MLCFALGAIAAGLLFSRTASPAPPPHVAVEPVRLARHARALQQCPGPTCKIDLEDRFLAEKQRRRRRRQRKARARNREEPTTNTSATIVEGAASAAAGAVATSAARAIDVGALKPLSPLPSAYALHLAYMEAHPANRPDASAGVRDSWGVAIVAHGNKVGYTSGMSKRDAELLAIMQQSGWDERDSPVVAMPPRAMGGATRIIPVLTGNAWHWGRQQCPRECVANEGVCLPDLGRCDCPRHRWGPQCELHVQPALARPQTHHGWCVYNDSSAFFCDKPVCEHSRGACHPSPLFASDCLVWPRMTSDGLLDQVSAIRPEAMAAARPLIASVRRWTIAPTGAMGGGCARVAHASASQATLVQRARGIPDGFVSQIASTAAGATLAFASVDRPITGSTVRWSRSGRARRRCMRCPLATWE